MDSIGVLVFRFATEIVKHAGNGFKLVDLPTYKERLTHCVQCPFFAEDIERCKLCGCHMPTKAKWETSKCPDDPPKWNRKNERKEGSDPTPGNGVQLAVERDTESGVSTVPDGG